MSDAAFFAEALPYARSASAATGVFTSVILAQWAIETGYGGPDWVTYHNPGNVGDPAAAGQTTYPTLTAGVFAYIKTMELGYYRAVREATTVTAQCYALGLSPWAAGRYMADGVAGELLVNVIDLFDLTQYDSPTKPTPGPAPTILEDLMPAAISADGKTIAAVRTDDHLIVATVGPSGTFNDASLVDLTDVGIKENAAGGPWTFVP